MENGSISLPELVDESADFFPLPDLTHLVKVSNPAPIFVGTYSHVLRGLYGGIVVSCASVLNTTSDENQGCDKGAAASLHYTACYAARMYSLKALISLNELSRN
jgi:hypothetical protein